MRLRAVPVGQIVEANTLCVRACRMPGALRWIERQQQQQQLQLHVQPPETWTEQVNDWLHLLQSG